MRIGIPKETRTLEKRVAAVPETVSKMIKKNIEVSVESSAGNHAYIDDGEYEKAGAKILKDAESIYRAANIILKVQCPDFDAEKPLNAIDALNENSVLIGILQPLQNLELFAKLNQKKVTTFSLEYLPRIARAQSMDVLSSMSNLAGYKSIVMAADHLGKIFPMLTTAAGTILPAKVLVIGAGVAGLQAIATARRLGAVVTALDTRPPVEEQVKSLGASFVSLEVAHVETEDKSGYAKELPPEFYQQEQDIIQAHLKDADVVITSALIPGKRAPLLITEEMVKNMRPGSVIVDLAAEQKGNCALTEPGKTTNKYNITIIGTLNIPSTLPIHASQLYAKNIWTFLDYVLPKDITLSEDKVSFDLTDEIVKNCIMTYQGEVVNKTLQQAIAAQQQG